MATKQGLLLLLAPRHAIATAAVGRARAPVLAVASSSSSSIAAERERLRELTRAALQHGGEGGVARAGAGDRRDLRHQVEVQELDELELHVAAGAPRPEERRHGEESVEVLERPRVLGRVDERRHERQERR